MNKPNKRDLTRTRAKESDDDRTIYAILREEFTAADLQKYTEIETMIPAEKSLRHWMKRIPRRPSEKKPDEPHTLRVF
jgi:hypothetical protein